MEATLESADATYGKIAVANANNSPASLLEGGLLKLFIPLPEAPFVLNRYLIVP